MAKYLLFRTDIVCYVYDSDKEVASIETIDTVTNEIQNNVKYENVKIKNGFKLNPFKPILFNPEPISGATRRLPSKLSVWIKKNFLATTQYNEEEINAIKIPSTWEISKIRFIPLREALP